MSGAIRSSMGPSLKRLKTMVELAQPILEQPAISEANVRALKLNGIKIKNAIQWLEERNQYWLDLINGLPVAERKAEETVYADFKYERKHFFEWIEKGKDILEDMEATEGVGPLRTTAHVAAPAQSSQRDPVEVQLERVSLPIFRGDPHEWPQFWQMFESLVDKGRFAPVLKLHYLLGSLRGEAKEAVQDIPITGENYVIVADILKQRFGNEKVLVEALQAELFRLPVATDSPLSLKKLCDNLERIFRQLKALKTNIENETLLGLIKSKLPRGILMELAKKEATAGESWDTTKFRSALTEYIRIQESVFQSTKHFHPSVKDKPAGESEKRDYRPTRQERTQTRNFQVAGVKGRNFGSKGNRAITCLFCDGHHMAQNCERVCRREDRVRRLSEQKRCFRCLRTGHFSNECQSRRNCQKCNGPHHVVLCRRQEEEDRSKSGGRFEATPRQSFGTSSNATPLGNPTHQGRTGAQRSSYQRANANYAWVKEREASPVKVEEQMPEKTGNNLSIQKAMGNRPGDTILMAQWVPVYSPQDGSKVQDALVFFDTGSQTSYISEKLVKRLNPPKVGEGVLEVNAFKSSEPIRFRSGKYILGFKRKDGQSEQMVLYSSASFTRGFRAACVGEVTENPSLEQVCRNLDLIDREPDILIGVAEFWRFFVRKRELAEEFFLIETTVGPIVCGRAQLVKAGKRWRLQTAVSIHQSNEEQMPSEETISTWWDLQTLGIKDDPGENEDETSAAFFEKNIRQVDGRYRTRWLWKEDNPKLPDNYGLAYRCLESILGRLQGMTDSELLEKYDAKIRDQLDKDIIEVAERCEGTLEHYLPHHPVVTHKLRLVYNASAKVRGGRSLNECLFRGPVLLPELVGMLLRCRLPKYVLLGDIEAAFLQIELEEPDREVAKFLWVKDINVPPTRKNLVIYRFKRVAFGVICSPYLLSATIQHHLKKYPDCDLAKELWDNTYMDNLMMSADSEDEIWAKYQESKSLFRDAKMNVREYITNASESLSKITEEDRLDTTKPKVLGIKWDLAKDQLEFKFPHAKEGDLITRQSVLSVLSSLFDPMGLLSPCVVQPKLYFQGLWDLAQTWEETIPEEQAERWRTILETWRDKVVYVPRKAKIEGDALYQLHVFVDASKDVYAAAVYLKSERNGEVDIHLIYSKNRLRSKSGKITIPRMELMAILVGVRALKFVEKELKLMITERHIWSDSKAALSWINLESAETRARFVANRLSEIRMHKNVKFHHVPTDENPADLATRGMTPEELQKSWLWWHGPLWLNGTNEEWPAALEFMIKEKPDLLEEIEPVQTLLSTMKWEEEDPLILANIINLRKFSTWQVLIGTVVIILRFLKMKFGKIMGASKKRAEIAKLDNEGGNHRELAEKLILKLAQIDRSDKLAGLEVDKDADGLVRLLTRIKGSDGNPEMQHPIVIPKDAGILVLLILDIHERMKHSGTESTLTEFLSYFWTPQARRKVKAVLKLCRMCRWMKANPFKLPKMANLPPERIQRSAPFSSIGIDYLGPTVYREEKGEIRKAWVILITCLCTRAVYLEPVRNMSTESFLLVFRRFVARRGCPKFVLSDNGTQFRMAAKVCDLVIRPTATKLSWKFTKELSPWQNGVVERLVAIFKDAFRRTLGKRILGYEELSTFVAECEAIMNQRPITGVNDNPQGDSEFCLPLRPIDFIQPRVNLVLDCENVQTEYPETPAARLADSWQLTVELEEGFCKRWHKDYLLLLRERSKWHIKGPRLQTHRDPRVGEIVIVADEFQPRNLWTMGKIVEIQGSNRPNEIRNVKVLMPNRKVLSRPISRLYPLEADPVEDREVPENRIVEIPKEKETQDKPVRHQMMTRRRAKEKSVIENAERGPRKTIGSSASLAMNLVIMMCLYQAMMPMCHGRPVNTNCPRCEAECVPKGVEIKMPKGVDKVEVCCATEEICTTHLYESDWTVILPEDLLINHHQCRISFWEKAKLKTRRELMCEPTAACDLISCYVCWNRFLNSHCSPRLTSFLFGAILFAIFFLTCGALWALRIIIGNIKFCCNIMGFVPKVVLRSSRGKQKKRYSEEDKEPMLEEDGQILKRSGRSTRWYRETMFLCFLAAILNTAEGEVAVTSVVAKSEDCIRTQAGVTCVINSVNTLTLLPAGQDVNLLIKDHRGNVQGNLKINLKSLSLHCVPKTEKWLRSYVVETGSAHSCPRVGSCQGSYCLTVGPSTQVPELEQWWKYPGTTRCKDSCGWSCGCTLPGSGCMFWKYYARPVTEAVYEVFGCQEWVYRIKASAELEIGGNVTMQTRLVLRNGMSEHWSNISFTLLPVAVPPSPILSKKFLSDGESVAMVEKVEGDLICRDEQATREMNCTLQMDACKDCRTREDFLFATCDCRDAILETYFEDPETSLPLKSPGFYLRNKKKEVKAETRYVPIRVIVKMHKFHLAVLEESSLCSVNVTEFSGCYRCVEGAGLNLTCTTDFGSALAEIMCSGGKVFTAKCAENGTAQMVSLAFDERVVNEKCEVECIGGKTDFQLRGELNHIFTDVRSKFELARNFKGATNGSLNLDFDWEMLTNFEEWANLIGSIFGDYYWIYAVGAIILGIFCVYVLLQCHPLFRGYRWMCRSIMLILVFDKLRPGGTLDCVRVDIHELECFRVDIQEGGVVTDSWQRKEHINPAIQALSIIREGEEYPREQAKTEKEKEESEKSKSESGSESEESIDSASTQSTEGECVSENEYESEEQRHEEAKKLVATVEGSGKQERVQKEAKKEKKEVKKRKKSEGESLSKEEKKPKKSVKMEEKKEEPKEVKKFRIPKIDRAREEEKEKKCEEKPKEEGELEEGELPASPIRSLSVPTEAIVEEVARESIMGVAKKYPEFEGSKPWDGSRLEEVYAFSRAQKAISHVVHLCKFGESDEGTRLEMWSAVARSQEWLHKGVAAAKRMDEERKNPSTSGSK